MKEVANEKHIGEAGKHKGHELELLPNGRVYCNDCQSPLGWKSADVAWPTK